MSVVKTISRAESFWASARTAEPPELGPGPRRPVLSTRQIEARLDGFGEEFSVEPDALLRLRATALLYHDHHDAAHDIVQDLPDQDAALIHAILHRREPDYWNARYWFRRFHAHPVYLSMGRRLSSMAKSPTQAEWARQLTLPGAFDPFAFVDRCEAVERSPITDPAVVWLREVQQAEFEELVEHLLA